MPLRVVPLQEATTGPCSCCGLTTHNLRGEVYAGDTLKAVYYLRWTAERLDGHAEWLLDLGEGRNVPASDRSIVALRCRSYRQAPAFMVVDALRTSWGPSVANGGRPLTVQDVVDQPIASMAYAVADQVLLQDPRVTALMRSMYAAEPPRWRRWLADRWGITRKSHRASDSTAEPCAPVT
jgi:hypothetical protein